jgi:hypothetical protein
MTIIEERDLLRGEIRAFREGGIVPSRVFIRRSLWRNVLEAMRLLPQFSLPDYMLKDTPTDSIDGSPVVAVADSFPLKWWGRVRGELAMIGFIAALVIAPKLKDR